MCAGEGLRADIVPRRSVAVRRRQIDRGASPRDRPRDAHIIRRSHKQSLGRGGPTQTAEKVLGVPLTGGGSGCLSGERLWVAPFLTGGSGRRPRARSHRWPRMAQPRCALPCGRESVPLVRARGVGQARPAADRDGGSPRCRSRAFCDSGGHYAGRRRKSNFWICTVTQGRELNHRRLYAHSRGVHSRVGARDAGGRGAGRLCRALRWTPTVPERLRLTR